MGTKPILAVSTQNECLTNEISDVAVKRAREQGQPFILAWRQLSNAEHPFFESDASCGCAPAD
jgi:hypothetical protein